MILDRPLITFDLETTGTNVTKDRIVSIAIIKKMPDGDMVIRTKKVNPEMPIPKEASDVHGITDDMVKDEPKFAQIAKGMVSFMGEKFYLLGFNNKRFDNDLLAEELARCGIDMSSLDYISLDAYEIYTHYNKRDLTAAYKHYVGGDLTNAHDALSDATAALEIFSKQILTHEDLIGKSVEEVAKMFKPDSYVDDLGRIQLDAEGYCIYGFGKSKGKRIKDDPDYGKWVLKSDFPTHIKNIIKKIIG